MVDYGRINFQLLKVSKVTKIIFISTYYAYNLVNSFEKPVFINFLLTLRPNNRWDSKWKLKQYVNTVQQVVVLR